MRLSDVEIILKQCKISTYFGFPQVSEITTNKLKKTFTKYYSYGIYSIYLIFTCYCLYQRSFFYVRGFSSIQSITDILQLLSEVSFLTVCLLWPPKRLRHWRMFWCHLKMLDKKLEKLNFEHDVNIPTYSGIVFLCFATVFSVHVYEILNWCKMGKTVIIYYYMNFRLAMYYHLFVVILICFVARMLRIRYDFLNRYLYRVLSRRRILWNISQSDSYDYGGVYELHEISRLYSALHDLIKLFNIIFGWHIFFTIKSTMISILALLNFIMSSVLHRDFDISNISIAIAVLDVMYSAVYLGCSTSIVLFCDKAEKSGKKISETCVYLQQGMPDCSARRELQFLAQFTKELSPEFTGAGFYKIRQTILTSFISTMATYIIITFQFNFM